MDIKKGREWLLFFDREKYEEIVPKSDQEKKMERPPFQKPYPQESKIIDLVPTSDLDLGQKSFHEVMNNRKSRRKFSDAFLTLKELSFLLWATQGLKKQVKFGTFRTVPSAGARSPFETCLYINKVEGLDAGLYRYLSIEHKLLFIKKVENPVETFTTLAYDQKFVGNSAVIFFWVAIPYRTEWR